MSNGIKTAPWEYLKGKEFLWTSPESFLYIITNRRPESIAEIIDVYTPKEEKENTELLQHFSKSIPDPKNELFTYYGDVGPENYLDIANRADIFIYDNVLRDKTTEIQCLTLFTGDIEANYYLLWNNDSNEFEFHCSFFDLDTSDIKARDKNFLKKIIKNQSKLNEIYAKLDHTGYYTVEKIIKACTHNAKTDDTAKIIVEKLQRINFKNHDCKYISNKISDIKEINNASEKFPHIAELIKKIIEEPTPYYNCVIFFNQYILNKEKSCNHKKAFDRVFSILHHDCRQFFNNIPLVTEKLAKEGKKDLKNSLKSPPTVDKPNDNIERAASAFYDMLGEQKHWLTAVGAPMLSSLDQLANAMRMSNESEVTFVTGSPGAGKSAYIKAIHFAGSPCNEETEKSLTTTTALELSNKYKDSIFPEKEHCSICDYPKYKIIISLLSGLLSSILLSLFLLVILILLYDKFSDSLIYLYIKTQSNISNIFYLSNYAICMDT